MGIHSAALVFLALAGVTHAADAPDAAALTSLGGRLYAAGRYREAEAPLTGAIAAWSGTSVEPPADLEVALHNLAAVYRAEARYSEALPLYRRAIELREARAGSTDLSMLLPLNGLALLYWDSGSPGASQDATRRAVSIAHLHRDEQTVDAANAFASLGSILAAQGDYSGANAWLGRALSIRRDLFGPESPAVADTLMELAAAARRAHRLPEAAKTYAHAVRIYEQSPRAPNYPAALLNLGRVLAEQGRRKQAESSFRQAVHEGGEPAAMSELAKVLVSQRRYSEARELLEQARAILERSLPAAHPEIGKVIALLADLDRSQGHLDEAALHYRQSLDILEPALGADNPRLLATLEGYARVLRAREDYTGAGSIDLRTMKIRVRQALGKSPENEASNLTRQGRP